MNEEKREQIINDFINGNLTDFKIAVLKLRKRALAYLIYYCKDWELNEVSKGIRQVFKV